MKKFRRSNKSGDFKQPPTRVLAKDAAAIEPPKKVVVATFSYQPTSGDDPMYLAFQVGDFFHVVARENDPDWYEVIDTRGQRGLVPANHFEVVGKTDQRQKLSKELHDSGYSENQNANPVPTGQARKQSVGGEKANIRVGNMVYGVVLYDFVAERPDELQANTGEHIIIIAQSNPEWYVAKPITRLGGPGLIPSAFVEVRNSTTNRPVDDPLEAVRAAGIPKVEEWKQRAAWYKNNSVPLGKLSQGSQQSLHEGLERMSMSTNNVSTRTNNMSRTSQETLAHRRTSSNYGQRNTLKPQQTSLVTPCIARITGYSQDSAASEFWYRVEVVNEDGRAWALRRCYKEFYDLQVHLMEQFPEAAGKVHGISRTLPYLPGPLPNTTSDLTERRQPYMHDYIYRVLHIDPAITNSHPMRLFFSPRNLDQEIAPFEERDIQRLSTLPQTTFPETTQQYNDMAAPAGANHDRHQQPTSQPYQYRPNSPQGQRQMQHHRSPSEFGTVNGLEPGPPQMTRNNSAFTSASTTSVGSYMSQPQNGATPAAIVKIKVFLGENCILLRLPSTFMFTDLVAKVRERWLLEPDTDRTSNPNAELEIEYKDEPTQKYYPIGDDHELRIAKDRNEKLTLRVIAINAQA